MQNHLIQKYNVPGPRYTSYPTVPYWDEANFSSKKWIETLQKSFRESNRKEGISLYLHLPFCESLCTFCACNKRITKQHSVETPYIEAMLKEWQMYLDLLPEKPVIREVHLGGGTPSFFSPENLKYLLENIFAKAEIYPEKEFGFEGHPNNTTQEHLQTLYNLGFRRVSFGVQDYDIEVQKAIHRIQPLTNVKKATETAREIGYESISHDLVFGLPFQNEEKVINTIKITEELHPDRIAFYSYAHVPWIKGVGQRGFEENDLPSGEEKRRLYEAGKRLLEKINYYEIGMDHFSLKTDNLYKSMINKKIHRNFMGYTSSSTQVMIGLGVSSISDSWYAFAQNAKTIEEYYQKLENQELPVFRGHILNEEDLIIRRHVLNLMCLLETEWNPNDLPDVFPEILERMQEFETDGLLQIHGNKITVKEEGRSFIRNICMAFDLRMMKHLPETRLFSMTV
ncbi:MAG: oxygen-independent coproporphyrinogen III oxidase [Flavobacteriaceae bacterium]|jgi:oxygen-independent coproporphyrinogen-3 oxidase|nr:oxygen-independent coproporphyrinogen III oxidase [Flavobacteriaceae bacterium]